MLDGIMIACGLAAMDLERRNRKDGDEVAKKMLRGRDQMLADIQQERYFLAAANLRRVTTLELLDTLHVPKRTGGRARDRDQYHIEILPKPFAAWNGETLDDNLELAACYLRAPEERLAPLGFFMDETPLISRYELAKDDDTDDYAILGGGFPTHTKLPPNTQLDDNELAKLSFDVLAKRPNTTDVFSIASFPLKYGTCCQAFVQDWMHNLLKVYFGNSWER